MKNASAIHLEELNEEHLKECNGGSILADEKKLLPPILYPVPNPDDKGRL
jgi:hypothetical protein